MADADRMRRYRRRRKAGRGVLHVPVDLVDWAATAIALKFIDPSQEDDRDALAAALGLLAANVRIRDVDA